MDEIKIDDAIFMVTLSYHKNEYSLDVIEILPMVAQYCSMSPFGKIAKFPGWEGTLSQICVRVPGGGNRSYGFTREGTIKRNEAIKQAKQQLVDDEIVNINQRNGKLMKLMKENVDE